MKPPPAAAPLRRFHLPRVRTGPAAASLAAFIAVSAVIMILGQSREDFGEFEAGKVAGRDVVAAQQVSFLDEEATRRRMTAQERLVPAVFRYSIPVNQDMRKAWERFVLFSQKLFAEAVSAEDYKFQVQAEFPDLAGSGTLEALFADRDRDVSLEKGFAALEFFIESGIFDLSGEILERYNPDTAELLHNYGARIERERIEYGKVITLERLPAAMARYCRDEELSASFAEGSGAIVLAICKENVFFSPEDTEQRLAEVQKRFEPVYRNIERGDKVIRKGFIVTEGEMERLRALDLSLARRDPRQMAGQICVLILLYALIVFLLGKRSAGRLLSEPECYMMTILVAGYLAGAAVAKHTVGLPDSYPFSVLLPTAFVVMLPHILIGFNVAVITALILPLGAFLSASFDSAACFFALCSGIAAAFSLQRAEKRMDLVKAGLVVAGVNAAAAVTALLLHQAQAAEYPPVLFWAAFNGAASGMLVMGILPLTEQALNAATPFRLIELSDLNSPILKRLFNAAPGTYSHSIMVANLAESACQDIGANALLARVGAYYHDIGKMEQPEFFVENQTTYNKHDDIPPRLSAAVIRNHVKVGLEKARALGLPGAVSAFIAEHHGSSLITWFYNEALKLEGQASVADFSYPGNPPHSRESAVVMLADVTEAAVRTLKKPTAAKLEKYLQELFDAKVASGQLSQSELTFHDMETIKNAFIKVLTGYYHSRIEYPRVSAETLKAVAENTGAPETGAAVIHEPEQEEIRRRSASVSLDEDDDAGHRT